MSSQQHILSRDASGSERRRLLYVTYAHYSEEWHSTLHTHACAELFFITGGHGVFQVWQNRFPVAINDLVVVNAGTPHTETSHMGSPMEYVVLGVEGLEMPVDATGGTLLHLAEEQAAVTSCLRMMVQEARVQQAGCDEICRGWRQMVHISKYHLAHTFQEEFHISPISYLISRRIQESHFLLQETDHTISQIAQILGFSSLSYFSQSFRRLEGISPIEFRRCHHKKGGESGS